MIPEPNPLLLPQTEEKDLTWKDFSKALLNCTRSRIFAVDPSGITLISNQLAQKTFGIYPGSLLDTTMPELRNAVVETLKDHAFRAEVSVQKENASYLASIGPILHRGLLIGVLCILDDQTELDKITRKMLSFQELTRELEGIIESSNDGLWISDATGKVLRINKASEKFNEVRAEEVIGRNMRDLIKEGFADRSVTLEVLKSRAPVNMMQTTRNGRKLMLTGTPVLSKTGKMIRVVVNERDITEIDLLRKELEEQAAIKEKLRDQMLEMQLSELEANRIIVRSPEMVRVFQLAKKLSRVDSTVLIQGESGTGKDIIADLIHRYSNRSVHPLIRINCGAIPETLVETELFGYEKGAFTGAQLHGKPGLFELADGGTLFLDEVSELPLSTQVKLLRFIEDGKINRVGGTASRASNVRILCATNHDLEAMVREGKFRLDLFYRLNVIPLRMPPLRERKECILPLIHYYLESFSRKMGVRKRIILDREAMDALLAYQYPGNVRELKNICERLVVMKEGGRVGLKDLPAGIYPPSIGRHRVDFLSREKNLFRILEKFERTILAEALDHHGTQVKMATALGVNQSTIARKLRKYGFDSRIEG